MHWLLTLAVIAAPVPGSEASQATRMLDGHRAEFPETAVPEGVKLLASVLESCHFASDGTPYDRDVLKKAQMTDHVRFVFPRALVVEVVEQRRQIKEAIYSEQSFWLVCEVKTDDVQKEEILRCGKYTIGEFEPFRDWYRQILPAR